MQVSSLKEETVRKALARVEKERDTKPVASKVVGEERLPSALPIYILRGSTSRSRRFEIKIECGSDALLARFQTSALVNRKQVGRVKKDDILLREESREQEEKRGDKGKGLGTTGL